MAHSNVKYLFLLGNQIKHFCLLCFFIFTKVKTHLKLTNSYELLFLSTKASENGIKIGLPNYFLVIFHPKMRNSLVIDYNFLLLPLPPDRAVNFDAYIAQLLKLSISGWRKSTSIDKSKRWYIPLLISHIFGYSAKKLEFGWDVLPHIP